MKKTLQIARLELKLLFYSPIAWLLLVALAIQMAMMFVPMLEIAAGMHEQLLLHPFYRRYVFSLSASISNANGSLFNGILSYLYLYIPLLTMGIVSRELGGRRTINLLYSSPVTLRQIVLGKYLAMLGFICAILVLVSSAAVFAAAGIEHFDYMHIVVGLIGIFLTLATFAAIGIFLSSLTTYQVIAAVLTFIVLGLLDMMGGFLQDKDILRDITYYGLWLGFRSSKMLDGLLTTRDVVYFFAIVVMFLSLTVVRLKGVREAWSIPKRVLSMLGVIACCITATYLTSRPGYIGYYDSTASKQNTISSNVQHLLEELDNGPIQVTQYINFFNSLGYQKALPVLRNQDKDRWEPYIRFKPDIQLHYVYYYDSITPSPVNHLYKDDPGKDLHQLFEKEAILWKANPSDFKTPEEIHRMIDLREERDKVVMQLEYKGRKTWLRTYDDPGMWPAETEIAAALKQLLHRPAHIAFVNGEYERSPNKMGDRDYKILVNLKTFRLSLVSQGFVFDTLSLKTAEIPDSLDALVLADPRAVLDSASIRKIRDYIDRGGNMLMAGEPGKQQTLAPLLKNLGVQLEDGQLLQQSAEYSPDLVTPFLAQASANLSLKMRYDQEDSVPVAMKSAMALSRNGESGFTISQALVTDSNTTWNKTGSFTLDSAAVTYDPAMGDRKGKFTTAFFLTRQINHKEQRIFVAGDADFMSNAELGRSDIRVNNFQYANQVFGWLVYNKYPVEIGHPRNKDVMITDLAAKVALPLGKIIFYGCIPGGLALAGLVIVLRRRRA